MLWLWLWVEQYCSLWLQGILITAYPYFLHSPSQPQGNNQADSAHSHTFKEPDLPIPSDSSCPQLTNQQILYHSIIEYHKSGSMFSSSEPVEASSFEKKNTALLETPYVCASQSNPPKLCRSVALRALPSTLQTEPRIIFWNSLQEWLSDNRQGLELKVELCSLTN